MRRGEVWKGERCVKGRRKRIYQEKSEGMDSVGEVYVRIVSSKLGRRRERAHGMTLNGVRSRDGYCVECIAKAGGRFDGAGNAAVNVVGRR